MSVCFSLCYCFMRRIRDRKKRTRRKLHQSEQRSKWRKTNGTYDAHDGELLRQYAVENQ